MVDFLAHILTQASTFYGAKISIYIGPEKEMAIGGHVGLAFIKQTSEQHISTQTNSVPD